jgi:hypothetical protein
MEIQLGGEVEGLWTQQVQSSLEVRAIHNSVFTMIAV